MENDTTTYCVPKGTDFQEAYAKVHGYIALIICILGSVANSINIAVLSRKEMASSTNSILTGLAVADLLVMLEYIPFALHKYIKNGSELNQNSYSWTVYLSFHYIFSQIFHTISIWLTITLAVWRFIAITFPLKNLTLDDKKNTNIAIAVVYVVCFILCLPMYFAIDIIALKDNSKSIEYNSTEIYNSTNSAMIKNIQEKEGEYFINISSQELWEVIFWIYSVIFKMIPCVILSILSVCLILKMKSIHVRRQKLLKESMAVTKHEGEKDDVNRGGGGRTDRTTLMLVAMLGLFLASELPQAVLGLMTVIAPDLFEICYFAFGEVMDILALTNSAVNFVLYCIMGCQFRSTFIRLAGKVFMMSRSNRIAPETSHHTDQSEVIEIEDCDTFTSRASSTA